MRREQLVYRVLRAQHQLVLKARPERQEPQGHKVSLAFKAPKVL